MDTDRIPVGDADSPPDVRAAVQAWIEEHVPAAWLAAARSGDVARLRAVRPISDYKAWYPAFAASGLVAPAWPVEHGGLGLPKELVRVVDEEVMAAKLVRLNVLGLGLAGPTILEWGDEEQCRRYLWPIVANTEVWCQLFSEPGAGSDLAGLGTRAVRDGDEWVVNGQKVWTTFAHEADRGMLLARTHPDLPKHQGITYFVLDMHSPGVDVRPLRQISGDAEFNEVFLTDVRAPDECRLGPEGAGWSVARTTLANERVAIAGAGGGFRERLAGRSVERLIEMARVAPPGGTPPAEDPAVRQRLARLYIESRLVLWTNRRAAAARAAGRKAGAEGSIGKLFQSGHNQRLQETAVDILGARGAACTDDDRDARSVWYGFLRAQADSIAGGTSDIQRNILGERVLGLPREPEPDRELPWSKVLRNA